MVGCESLGVVVVVVVVFFLRRVRLRLRRRLPGEGRGERRGRVYFFLKKNSVCIFVY